MQSKDYQITSLKTKKKDKSPSINILYQNPRDTTISIKTKQT